MHRTRAYRTSPSVAKLRKTQIVGSKLRCSRAGRPNYVLGLLQITLHWTTHRAWSMLKQRDGQWHEKPLSEHSERMSGSYTTDLLSSRSVVLVGAFSNCTCPNWKARSRAGLRFRAKEPSAVSRIITKSSQSPRHTCLGLFIVLSFPVPSPLLLEALYHPGTLRTRRVTALTPQHGSGNGDGATTCLCRPTLSE
jgi:hypothetical protein